MLYHGPEEINIKDIGNRSRRNDETYRIGIAIPQTYYREFNELELKVIDIIKFKLNEISASNNDKNITMDYIVKDKNTNELLLHKKFAPISKFMEYLRNNSLYKSIGSSTIILEIELEDNRRVSYKIMETVWFNGSMYISLIDNNMLSPERFPYGWEIIDYNTPLYEEMFPNTIEFEQTKECNRPLNEIEILYKRKAERLIDWDKF